MEQQIPKADAKRAIGTKREFYRGLCRLGFHLPNFKTTICTKAFLIEVREGRVWMPRACDIRLGNFDRKLPPNN